GKSTFYLLKDIYNSPKNERLVGGSHVVCINILHFFDNLAIWCDLFSDFDCWWYMSGKRMILGIPSSLMSWPPNSSKCIKGLGPALHSSLFGGMLIALIEGVAVCSQMMSNTRRERRGEEESREKG
ncbi:mitochondrial import inner membrane translocase subunit TIM17-2-like, partial [Olea europaea var. sylvestris]|uniref:mitochondrial import inner membrane translocase subunit TIM17-2-like n=1 Tax=Olea europaea var. sylvestris TaxID=158386 RepID=UPI000C1D5950